MGFMPNERREMFLNNWSWSHYFVTKADILKGTTVKSEIKNKKYMQGFIHHLLKQGFLIKIYDEI